MLAQAFCNGCGFGAPPPLAASERATQLYRVLTSNNQFYFADTHTWEPALAGPFDLALVAEIERAVGQGFQMYSGEWVYENPEKMTAEAKAEAASLAKTGYATDVHITAPAPKSGGWGLLAVLGLAVVTLR